MKRIVDKETNLFIRDDFTHNRETEIALDVPPAQGLHKPKWNGEEWVEGLSQEEIDEIKGEKTKRLPTPEERVDSLENTVLNLMMEGL